MDKKVAEERVKMINEIERLRHDANKLLAEGRSHNPEVLDISKRIDELIVKYMKID